jgi:hypothetical protein
VLRIEDDAFYAMQDPFFEISRVLLAIRFSPDPASAGRSRIVSGYFKVCAPVAICRQEPFVAVTLRFVFSDVSGGSATASFAADPAAAVSSARPHMGRREGPRYPRYLSALAPCK